MKKTKHISFIALFLITAMILPHFVLNIFAAGVTSEKLSKQNSGEVKIIGEDVNLRGEFEKHFILEDGTYLAVSYREAVHYLKDDKWEEIDNSLVYSEKKGKFENANGVGERISVGADSDGSFSAGIGEISWSWSVSSGSRTEDSVFTKKMSTTQSVSKKSAVGMKVSALSQASLTDSVKTLKVGGAFATSNVDIECSISKDKIKENLIINKKNSVDVLVMSINAEGYSLTLDDGKVTFVSDEKNSEYFIDPPVMFDATGESSCDIKTELYDLGSGKYAIVYTPSEEWLAKAEYPVVFDPTVYNDSHYCNIEDTYVEEFVTRDMSKSLDLCIGRNSGPWRKAFIRINNLPGTGGLPIISAGINFKMTQAESSLAGMNVVMSEVEFAEGTKIEDIRYTTPFTEIQRIGSFGTVSPPVIMSYDLLTDRFIDNCTNGKSMTYALYIDESQRIADGRMSIASSESSDISDRPIFSMIYGYQRPENFISTSVSNIGSNRFFLKNNIDTSAMSNRMIKTNGYSIATDLFNTGDPRGHFAFIGSDSSDFIKIYGCYDGVYVSAFTKNDNTEPEVTTEPEETEVTNEYPFDGSSIIGTSSSDAIEWIIVQCGQFDYRIMPSCDLSLSLAMTENGDLRLEKYDRSKKGQTWSIISDSVQNAGLSVKEGEYVINSSASKTFLIGSETNVLARAALKSSNEKTMKWKFQYVGNGYYIIESNFRKGKYLSISSSEVAMKNASNISNDILIKIESTTQGYYLSSKAGYYLSINSGGTVSSLSYKNTTTCCMRLREFDNYRELNEINVNSEVYDVGDQVQLKFNGTFDFCDSSYFSFTKLSGSNCMYMSSSLLKAGSNGSATYKITHLPTGKNITLTFTVDGYVKILVNEFGFTPEAAVLIRGLYDRLEAVYPNDNDIQLAWKFCKLSGDLQYNEDDWDKRLFWDEVTGRVLPIFQSEMYFFTETLNYSEEEYYTMKNAVMYQYSHSSTIDYAHMQIAAAGRLAYYLGITKELKTKSFTVPILEASYFVGWLGDAVLAENNGTTSLKNDDYCADLDAENIYSMIIDGSSYMEAVSDYYSCFTPNNNRATIFLSHINYEYVKKHVFYYLVDYGLELQIAGLDPDDMFNRIIYSNLLADEDYHWNILDRDYHDTYNFLKSLQDLRHTIGEY